MSSISKRTVTRNSEESTKSDNEDLVPYYATISMAKEFKNFYISHVPRQQNAHADALASLAASLALLAGETEEVLVHNCDLYYLKFAIEDSKSPKGDLQVKEVLETSTSPDSLTSSYTAYCLTILKRRLQSKGKLLSSITMRLREHYIVDCMMESYSAAFQTKRQLTMVRVGLTNLDPN